MTISLEKILKKVLLPAVMAVVLNGCGTLTYFAGSEIIGTKTQRGIFLEKIMSDGDSKRAYGNPQVCPYATLLEFRF